MSPARKQLKINRVLIALDTSTRDNHTLDTAARLAALRNVELITLFIEDQDLLHLAELPFASEIERSSGTVRKLDSLQMARALKSEAQRLSRHLETITGQLRLRYSLKVVRGSYMAEAMAAAMKTDILFLSKNVGKYRRHSLAARTALFRRGVERTVPTGTVWSWYQATPGSEAALAVAAELAAEGNKRLVVLQRAGVPEPDEKIRQLIRQRRIDYTIMAGMEPSALAGALQRVRDNLLVVHAADLSEKDQLTTASLENLGYPVAVVF